ncbi:N-acetylneuraminate synthase family protein [Methanospirillum sp.]|uniref:N-acetylneuraminate synthase family protein n=1 Tax=Methanospirillum sp. TaxID=45200 RepID=UPI0035A18D26
MVQIKIGSKIIDGNRPAYIIAEIGINHNGELGVAKSLIDLAVLAGCDAVKFQKRTPDICVPEDQKQKMRETPWGYISYLEYRYHVEFGEEEYLEINRYCKEKGIDWLASCWDIPSVDFIGRFNPVAYKVPSACLTDNTLLEHINKTGRPVILSTGMSTMEEIEHAVSLIDHNRLIITHTTSTYPCPARELNLLMIRTLMERFSCPVGYSGHETGLQTTIAAVALGASLVERHITLDRAMWGSDQAASVEPGGLIRLVRDIRVIEQAMGDGVKRVFESEIPIREKLRCK